MRKVIKWTVRIVGGLIAIAAVIAGLFIAFNWTLVRNISRTMGAEIEAVDRYEPHAVVKSCAVRDLPVASAASTGLSRAAIDQAQALSDASGGKGLIILHDGKVVHERYAPGFGPQTLFETFSMHKSVLALAIGNAIRDGVLPSIDVKASALLPQWRDDARAAITLRDLLTMSSGLRYYSITKSEMPAMNLALSDKVEATALASPADGKPGVEFAYNNANSQAAGAVLRQAIKQAGRGDYAEYLSQSLWCPLGNGPARLWLEAEGGAPRFFAHLQASVRDWARIGQMIADGGKVGDEQVVPADWLMQMAKPAKTNPNYGLHVWRGSPWPKEGRRYSRHIALVVPHAKPYLADDVLFFDGFGGQRVYVVPSARIVVVRVGKPSMTWDDSSLLNAVLAGVQPSPAL